MPTDYSTYQSALTIRFGSPEMRRLFSEEYKYRLWREIWVALAAAEHAAGLVSAEELADLRAHADELDIERIYAIERETQHDVVAAIREFAEKARVGGGKIHLGATSMDINDNADVLRMARALAVVEERLGGVLEALAGLVERYAETPALGYTHLQPAEPTTLGYRVAFYAQDLLGDLLMVRDVRSWLRGKGMKGAVGTRASYTAILDGTSMSAGELDAAVMRALGLEGALVTTQVVSRKQEYWVVSALAGVGSTLAKLAGDVRVLQSPGFGEWAEPFGRGQVGSSAMPFKKNPRLCEKICSLARLQAALPAVALENVSLSYLERTLDDSANRRLVLPEAFLLADEVLLTADKVVRGLTVNEARVARNLQMYAPFAATEAIIIAAVKAGADRQAMHERLRGLAMRAWEQVAAGEAGAMAGLLRADKTLAQYVPARELERLLDVRHHVGDAPARARELAALVREELKTGRKGGHR
jgi:adenylosuccinate lyase